MHTEKGMENASHSGEEWCACADREVNNSCKEVNQYAVQDDGRHIPPFLTHAKGNKWDDQQGGWDGCEEWQPET